MIREILLRLNDHRDLVNSAQASPVMRTMIDNQCIWRKMCRYHFTDQQLKLAFESNKFNFVKKQSCAQLRGIKYARTTSADGRSSYRSPVAAGALAAANKRQASRTAASQQLDGESKRADSKSSYVTNAVRIFDKERASSAGSSSFSSSSSSLSGLQSTARLRQSSQGSDELGVRPPSLSSSPSPSATAAVGGAANDSALEIDWERVFHQLRK
jgi:hypothetical protein